MFMLVTIVTKLENCSVLVVEGIRLTFVQPYNVFNMCFAEANTTVIHTDPKNICFFSNKSSKSTTHLLRGLDAIFLKITRLHPPPE